MFTRGLELVSMFLALEMHWVEFINQAMSLQSRTDP